MSIASTLPNAAAPAESPDTSHHIEQGLAAERAGDARAALAHYEAALAEAPLSYEANWRASSALMAVGQQTTDKTQGKVQASLYERAEACARRAVAANPQGANGHYVLSQAIGLASLAKDSAERVKRAGEIRTSVLRALELEPNHDGAFHVLGRWHAALARVPPFQRFIARNALGGRVFDQASWAGALDNLEKAVALAPHRIDHHLCLAELYVERKSYAKARVHLAAATSLPFEDVQDASYKQQAVALTAQIEGKVDGR
jgi:tetratricopeptide (TPR) repeat protein